MSLIDEIQSYLKAVSPFNETAYTKMPKRLLGQAVEEITHLNQLIDQIGACDNAKMHLMQTEINKLRELLNTAAGLLFRLEKYHYINTDDETCEAELEHWRGIGRDVVNQASILLNSERK